MKKSLKIAGISIGSLVLLAFGIQGFLLRGTPGQSLSPQKITKIKWIILLCLRYLFPVGVEVRLLIIK